MSDGRLSTPRASWQLSRRLATVLRELESAGGAAVARNRLLDAYWGQGVGSQQDLAKAVFELRKLFAHSSCVFIDSVYGYGYRLRVDQQQVAEAASAAERAREVCEEAAHRGYDRRVAALHSALELYRMAARIDPDCTRAYLGYVQTTLQLLATGQGRTSECWPAARHALDEADQHQSATPVSLALRGLGRCLFDWDYRAAAAMLSGALAMDPQGYLVNECAGRCSLFRGDFDSAVAHLNLAAEANPAAMNTRGLLAYALGNSGDTDAARVHAAEIRRIDASDPMALTYFAWVEAAWGDAEEACAVGSDVLARVPRSVTIAAVNAYALAAAGRVREARRIATSLSAVGKYPGTGFSVLSHAWRVMDEPTLALAGLEAGAAEREYWVGTMLNSPLHASLRDAPEFRTLYQKVFRADAPRNPE